MSVSDQPQGVTPNNEPIIKEGVKPENETVEQLSVEELVKQVEELKASKARVLDESVKWKSKAKSYEDKATQFESVQKEKLSAEEQLQVMQNELREREAKLQEKESKLLNININEKLKALAPDCYDPKVLFAYDSISDVLELNADGTNVTDESAMAAINKARDIAKFAFRPANIPSMETGGPNNIAPNESVDEKLKRGVNPKELSTDELKKHLFSNYKIK